MPSGMGVWPRSKGVTMDTCTPLVAPPGSIPVRVLVRGVKTKKGRRAGHVQNGQGGQSGKMQ